MSMTATMALICFVSSNPSPQHWVVSGRIEAVARLDATVATLDDIRRIAHAEDGDTAFSHYELAAYPNNRTLWPLISSADRDGLVSSRFQNIVPSCPSGETSAVGNPQSSLAMGLIGPAAAVERLNLPMAYAMELEDGRAVRGFFLRDVDRDTYDDLIRAAAADKLKGLDLVLMRPADEASATPSRDRRIDHMRADADRR